MSAESDAEKLVDVDTFGEDALSDAKQILATYDIDDEDVAHISVDVFGDRDAEAVDEDTNGHADSDHVPLDEANRKVQGVQQNCSYHLTLAALAQHTDENEQLSANELAEVAETGSAERSNVSTALSELYRRKLVDRDASQRAYEYWVTSYGHAELDEKGREVDPADVGGVWAVDV